MDMSRGALAEAQLLATFDPLLAAIRAILFKRVSPDNRFGLERPFQPQVVDEARRSFLSLVTKNHKSIHTASSELCWDTASAVYSTYTLHDYDLIRGLRQPRICICVGFGRRGQKRKRSRSRLLREGNLVFLMSNSRVVPTVMARVQEYGYDQNCLVWLEALNPAALTTFRAKGDFIVEFGLNGLAISAALHNSLDASWRPLEPKGSAVFDASLKDLDALVHSNDLVAIGLPALRDLIKAITAIMVADFRSGLSKRLMVCQSQWQIEKLARAFSRPHIKIGLATTFRLLQPHIDDRYQEGVAPSKELATLFQQHWESIAATTSKGPPVGSLFIDAITGTNPIQLEKLIEGGKNLKIAERGRIEALIMNKWVDQDEVASPMSSQTASNIREIWRLSPVSRKALFEYWQSRYSARARRIVEEWPDTLSKVTKRIGSRRLPEGNLYLVLASDLPIYTTILQQEKIERLYLINSAAYDGYAQSALRKLRTASMRTVLINSAPWTCRSFESNLASSQLRPPDKNTPPIVQCSLCKSEVNVVDNILNEYLRYYGDSKQLLLCADDLEVLPHFDCNMKAFDELDDIEEEPRLIIVFLRPHDRLDATIDTLSRVLCSVTGGAIVLITDTALEARLKSRQIVLHMRQPEELELPKIVCGKPLPCRHPCMGPEGHSSSCTWYDCKVEDAVRCEACTFEYVAPCGDKVGCPAICNKVLKCGHRCIGTCGGCSGGRLHVACTMPCQKILPYCGHNCKKLCGVPCAPCTQPCLSRCTHSGCRKVCGAPCDLCEKSCDYKCQHKRCGATCGAPMKPMAFEGRIGHLELCLEPCKASLKCGHPCAGLCGQACVCVICDVAAAVNATLLSNAEVTTARWLKLDCSHFVEINELQSWFEQILSRPEEERRLPRCPFCLATLPRGGPLREISEPLWVAHDNHKNHLYEFGDAWNSRKQDIEKLQEVRLFGSGAFKRAWEETQSLTSRRLAGLNDEDLTVQELEIVDFYIRLLSVTQSISHKLGKVHWRSVDQGEVDHRLTRLLIWSREYSGTSQQTYDFEAEVQELKAQAIAQKR